MPDLPPAPTVDSRHHRWPVVGLAVLLAAALAAAPFLPGDRDANNGAMAPQSTQPQAADTAGPGAVTVAMRAEIDRVVAATSAVRVGRTADRQQVARLAEGLVRCADFEGQTYCLGQGWTTRTEAEVQQSVADGAESTVTTRTRASETTGDLDALGHLLRRATMTRAERAAADRAELTSAARSVAKVWLLRHQLDGVELPAGFLDAHPEARAPVGTGPVASSTTAASTQRRKEYADYPDHVKILDAKQVAQQHRSYWCGPTSMQMIAWAWSGTQESQTHWARRLDTTTSGTSITDLVQVVNDDTGWDKAAYAGPYVVLDIADYSFRKWRVLMMRHITDYRAPVVLHPVLEKRFYPYLDDDASGHFQVGRGFRKRGDRPDQVGYFEPWNQQRFDPSEPFIERVQWRNAYRSFRANQAHFAHNVGV